MCINNKPKFTRDVCMFLNDIIHLISPLCWHHLLTRMHGCFANTVFFPKFSCDAALEDISLVVFLFSHLYGSFFFPDCNRCQWLTRALQYSPFRITCQDLTSLINVLGLLDSYYTKGNFIIRQLNGRYTKACNAMNARNEELGMQNIIFLRPIYSLKGQCHLVTS